MQHTVESIRALLSRTDNTGNIAVERAVVAIYNRQTEDEQDAQETGHKNGMGFNGTDAFILSSFAEQILKSEASGRYPAGRRLSSKQREIARKKIMKYSRQLLEVAKERAAVKEAA